MGTDSDPAPSSASSGPPTLRDVAVLSGVSIKTVSRVLNEHPHVSERTARRVREAAGRLGFRLNRLARDLRAGGGSDAVGFVVGDLSNPFYTQIAVGVDRTLREHGLELFVATADDDAERERHVTLNLLERRIRALFVVPVADDHTHLRDERRRDTPVIFVDRPPVDLAADSVVLENRRAARQATHDLIGRGHRRIGLIADQPELWTARERVQGFAEAMRQERIPDWERYVRRAHDMSTAREAARELMSDEHPPTALFTLNNRLTLGTLDVLRGLPEPHALVGFDDFELAEVLGISVISHDPVDLGRRAAELALDRLENPSQGPQQIVLPTSLVPRGSGEVPAPATTPSDR